MVRGAVKCYKCAGTGHYARDSKAPAKSNLDKDKVRGILDDLLDRAIIWESK